MVNARRKEDGKEENGNKGEEFKSSLQRVLYFYSPLRENSPDESSYIRDGLRSDGEERSDRTDCPWSKEWGDGDETLERNVQQEQTKCNAVAYTEGLWLI